MKRNIFLLLLSVLTAQLAFAQQTAKLSDPEFGAYHKKRVAETEEQHRLVAAYLSPAGFEILFAEVVKSASVAETDKKGFRKMIAEKYSIEDRNNIISKINSGEINKANIAGFFQKKTAEYASYYKAAFLAGKGSLVAENAMKIKVVDDKGLAQVLSQKLGTNVTLAGPCGNIDFEAGNFGGWTGNYTTSNCTSPTPNTRNTAGLNFTTVNTTSDGHGLCTGGFDPAQATLQCVSPFGGGGYSLRLGDVTDGCSAADISFTFAVNASNTNFTYSYAAVLYDGHPAGDAPKVKVDMFDLTTGQVIPCASYYIDATQAAQPASGFTVTATAGLYYKPWSLVFVPLQAYVGDNVQVNLITSDCNGGAHRGYAYFDFSCQPFQIATSSPQICNGASVILTAPGGALTYSWNNTSAGGTTGIVGSATTQSCTVNQPGTYMVTMNNIGSTCTYTANIVVPGSPTSPIANFSNGPACVGQPMSFTDLSSPHGGSAITGWHWNFGNTATLSDTANTSNPNYAYPASGTYTVTLDVNNGCVATYSATITVNPTPSVTVANQGPFCPGDAVPSPVYVPNPNDPATTYVWTNNNTTIGLGGNGVGVPPPFTVASNNTLANITGVVTVTPTLNGCVGPPGNYTITVKPTPFKVYTPSVQYCPGVSTAAINFTVIPGGGAPTFIWTNVNMTPFGLANSGTTNIPSFQTINTGTTVVTGIIHVIPTLNGCTGPDSTFMITVNPNPTAAFFYSRACIGSPTTLTDESTVGTGTITNWNWDLNNDGIFLDATNQSPTYSFSPAGWHNVGLSVTSNKGCKGMVVEPIYVNYPPNPNFVGDVLMGCPVHPVNFQETSVSVLPAKIIDWSWDFGNGQTSVSQQPTTVLFYNSSPILPIYYNVSLTVKTDSGCVGSITKPNYVMVYPQPIAGFSWDPTDADILDPTIHFYNSSVGGNGNLPIKYYLGDYYLGQQDPRNWTNLTNPIHTYNDQTPGTYYVTQWVKNIYGCKDSITHPITINPAYTFYIPNAFSPNGDGRNEGFKGTGIGIDPTTYNIWIFDRWGNQIFQTTNMEETWNGRVNGVMVQEDTYCWKVRFSDISGAKHEYHGIVNLIK